MTVLSVEWPERMQNLSYVLYLSLSYFKSATLEINGKT